MKIVVILPTYNERDNILALLTKLEEVSRNIPKHSLVFLVVDDTSPDRTANIVKEYAKTHKNVQIIIGEKQGLGKALLRGMTYAVLELKAEIVAQMDADLSHDPQRLVDFIYAIEQGADFVVGSRYISGGSIPSNWGPHRKIFSIAGNAIVRFGLGFPKIHDWTGGFRAYKKTYYEQCKDEMKKYSGYVFQIAFLHNAVLHGANIVEVPIHFTDRKFGRSKIAPSQYIRDVLGYVFLQRSKRLKQGPFSRFLVVGFIGFMINTLVLELLVASGFHPSIGSALGAETAIISNFLLNNYWTFRSRKIKGFQQLTKFIQFNATSFGAIAIQAGLVTLGIFLFGVGSYRIYYLFGVGLSLFYNYIMYSRVIWKHRGDRV